MGCQTLDVALLCVRLAGRLRAQDLDALGTLPKLTHLSLLDNEVAKQPNYRRAECTSSPAAPDWSRRSQ